jgi:hypothetical protein
MIEEKKINTIFGNQTLTDGGDKIMALKGVIFTVKIGLQGKAARDHGPPATLLNVSARQVFGCQVHFCLF